MAARGSAIWLDVLPAMNKLAPNMTKGATVAAKTAGTAAGRQFSASLATGAKGGAGASALVKELEGASKQVQRVITKEKTAIYQARNAEKAAAQGVQVAEARLAEQRTKASAASARVTQTEQALAAARQKHGAESKQAALAEQSFARAQAQSQAVTANGLRAEQALTVARGKVGVASMKTTNVEGQLREAYRESATIQQQLGKATNLSVRETALMNSALGKQAALGAPVAAGLSKIGGGIKQITAGALGTLRPLAGMASGFAAIVGVQKVITLGNEYTKTMNELQAVAGLTDKQMTRVGATARALGSDLTLPATSGKDAADIMLELAKGGLTANAAMVAAKGTIQLAAAAQVEGGRAAEIQANALNQFGLSAKSAGMVADVLANTANAAAGGVNDIATSMKYVGPVARSMGINIQGTAAAVGLLANNGLKGDTAGTALRGMLVSLAAPSKKAGDAIASLNIEAFDSQGKFVGMRKVIDQLSEAQKTMTKEQFAGAAATAFGREPLAAVTALASSGAGAYDRMTKAVGRQGGAAMVAQSQMKGLGGSMDKLQSQLEDVALGIYQTVTPALTAAVNGIAGGLDGASGKVTAFLKVAGGLGKLAMTGAGGPSFTMDTGLTATSPAVTGILAARKIIVAALGDVRTFIQTAVVPSFKNMMVAVGPLVAILVGGFLGALRAAASVLANVIGPALVSVTGFLRDHQGVVIAAAAVIGYLVLAYKAQQLQLAILEAQGLRKFIAATKLGVFWTNASAAAMTLWKGAMIAGKAVAFTYIAATRGMAAAQIAFNIAASANPLGLLILGITLVVAAIAALVAGVIWAYNNIGWFKAGVDAVWRGIVAVATWAWQTVLKPTFDAIVTVVRFVGSIFTWWWQNVTMPVFRGIAAVVGWFWNTFSAIVQLIVAMVRVTLGAVFTWLYRSVVKPVFGFISVLISAWWLSVKLVFSAVVGFLRGTLGVAFMWLYRNAVKPAWAGIKTAISVVWSWLQPLFSKLEKWAKVTLPAAFSAMKAGISAAWKAIKETAKAPIRFVVNTVINDALIGNFNKVADAFGTKHITPIALPKGFAGGGVIPGYQSAKRDDAGLHPLRRGEGILVPEVVRAINPATVHALNAAGNRGGVSAVRQLTGYAKGGIAGRKNAGSDGGGPGGLVAGAKAAWKWTKGAAGNAWDWTKNAAETAANIVTDPMGTLGKLVKSVIGKIPGAGRMTDIASGMGTKFLNGAISLLKKIGGSDGGKNTGANGQIARGSLMKVSGFTGGPGVGPLGGYLRIAAARAWERMQKASGGALGLTEGYRSLADQQMRYAAYRSGRGNLAATPGSSIHGFGNAADIGAGQAWVRANGARYGWQNTGLGFSQREPWHFEFKGAPAAAGGMARGGVVGSRVLNMTPTLLDRGGVLPRGVSFIENRTQKPEYALPEDRLVDIVGRAGADDGGGDHITVNATVGGTGNHHEDLRDIRRAVTDRRRGGRGRNQR